MHERHMDCAQSAIYYLAQDVPGRMRVKTLQRYNMDASNAEQCHKYMHSTTQLITPNCVITSLVITRHRLSSLTVYLLLLIQEYNLSHIRVICDVNMLTRRIPVIRIAIYSTL